MTTKKSNGEGSVNRYGNGWRGTITVGRDSNGKLIRKQFYGKTKKETLEKLDQYKSDLSKGLDIEKDNYTVKSFLTYWLYEYKKVELAESTFYLYECFINKYLIPGLGTIKLKNLKPHHIQCFYNERMESGDMSIGYAHKIQKMFKSAVYYAINHSYITHDPIRSISLPKCKEKKKLRAFTLEEQSLLLDAFKNHKHGLLFKITLGTGLRLGEVIALKWSDVNNNILTVSKMMKRSYDKSSEIWMEGSVKTQSSNRDVPIPLNILKELNALKKTRTKINDEYIFITSKGRPLKNDTIRKSFSELLSDLKIQDATFHTLRHTYATRLFENDVPLKTVSILLGHADINITANVYTHVLENEKIRAVDTINNIFKEKESI